MSLTSTAVFEKIKSSGILSEEELAIVRKNFNQTLRKEERLQPSTCIVCGTTENLSEERWLGPSTFRCSSVDCMVY